MTVKRTNLTDQFTLEDFADLYGGEAVVLFAVRGDEIDVVTEKTNLEGELTLIALVPEDEVSEEMAQAETAKGEMAAAPSSGAEE